MGTAREEVHEMERDDFEPSHDGGGPATTGEPGGGRRVIVMRAVINLADLQAHIDQAKAERKGGAK